MAVLALKDMVTIIYFDNESYLHKLYIGHAITALQQLSKQIKVEFIDAGNLQKTTRSINSKYIIVFLSLGGYDIFEKFCEHVPKDSILVVCHYIPTYLGEKIMSKKDVIDYMVIGEFDITLPSLIQYIDQSKNLNECPGILLRKDGCIKYTGARSQIEDLDAIGFVNRDALPSSSSIFHMFASRGCEGNCTFCDRNALYIGGNKKQRFRSIKNVVEEIDLLVEKYGCRFVTFSDSTFCGAKNCVDRLNELYVELKSKDYWVQFFINLRVEQLSCDVLGVLQKLATVGLSRVFVGLESFNESDLCLYNKPTSTEINRTAIQNINKLSKAIDQYHLDFEFGFIMFNPYTRLEELKNNINQLKKCKIDLNPNIISSRIVCNYMQPLTKIVDKDGMLSVSLNSEDISRITAPDIKYSFRDSVIARIYEVISSCYDYLSIKLYNNITYIRNRYFHFYGGDSYLNNLDESYLIWKKSLSDFCETLIKTVIKLESTGVSSRKYAIELCSNFRREFSPVEHRLEMCKRRILIQLQKINEEIYE